MTLISFSRGGITYRQQYRACGRSCSRCPHHGPYWYALWWSGGKPRTMYVGTKLPDGITPPSTRPADPPARKPIGRIEALRLLRINLADGWTVAQKKWIFARNKALKALPYDAHEVIRIDEAWAVVQATFP